MEVVLLVLKIRLHVELAKDITDGAGRSLALGPGLRITFGYGGSSGVARKVLAVGLGRIYLVYGIHPVVVLSHLLPLLPRLQLEIWLRLT